MADRKKPAPRSSTTRTVGQRQAREKLIQRAKSQLEQMIDLNPESMVLVDVRGQVLRANRAFVSLVRASSFGKVLGRTLTALIVIADARFFDNLLKDRTDRESREVTAALGDGEERLLRFAVVAGPADSDTLVVIARDATLERSQAELVAKAYKVDAIRALMGALMHHMNQPLTVLMVRARLMQQAVERGQATPEQLKTTFDDIMDLAMRMANVLKKVEGAGDYQTQRYIDGLDILKIDEID